MQRKSTVLPQEPFGFISHILADLTLPFINGADALKNHSYLNSFFPFSLRNLFQRQSDQQNLTDIYMNMDRSTTQATPSFGISLNHTV